MTLNAKFNVVVFLTVLSTTALAFRTTKTNYYDVCDQVTLLGYPCEHHSVPTLDGFHLGLLRIPPKNNSSVHAYPVLLQHGLIDSAITWVANAHPSQNLACLLHDAGYDVWLGNSRGNHYSRNNSIWNENMTAYWQAIDFDGMGQYDVPANVRYALSISGKPRLAYVGHSQGGLQAFSAFSTFHRPLAETMVDVFIGLAPASYCSHMGGLAGLALRLLNATELLKLLGSREVLSDDYSLRQFTKLCPILGTFCWGSLLDIFGQGNSSNVNASQLDIITRYDPAGTSTWNFLHFQQLILNGTFGMHDWGTAENMKKYGQPTPPPYTLNQMTHPPTYIFSGSKDALVAPADVAKCIAVLQNSTGKVLRQHVVIEGYEHMDFVWGLDAAVKVYQPILKILSTVSGK